MLVESFRKIKLDSMVRYFFIVVFIRLHNLTRLGFFTDFVSSLTLSIWFINMLATRSMTMTIYHVSNAFIMK
jgi:hypothetical protein